MNDLLREKLHKLPDLPGCYMMKDSAGKIIYVGKAVNLKNRVRSYFRGAHDSKTEALVANIADFDTIVVQNEAEALILESNLIKRYSPHYNILLRDDKHYPYLRLTLEEEFPRLVVARRALPNGSRYFGPYPNVGAMHRAEEVIKEIFPLRTCRSRSFKKNQRACLNAHIGRCTAPCEGNISREAYMEIVEGVSLFLQGKTKSLIEREQQLMEEAAQDLRFEDAATHRDRIVALESIQEQQHMDCATGIGDYDILAVAAAEDQAVVMLFNIRNGNVVGREHFFLTNASTGMDGLLMERFIAEYYGGGQFLPRTLYCNALSEEAPLLADMLSGQCGHKVELSIPQRGDKKPLMRLAEENARMVLFNYLESSVRRERKNAAGLEHLRTVLGLSAAPRRIECYDISHVQGTYMVGSMVVFINGASAPKLYRRFKIKTLEGSNDFAALQEVLERRWRHGWKQKEQGKTDDFADFPDLLVIDGGKGQLHAVCDRLKEIGAVVPAIISLAKREEEIFVPGQSEPIVLPFESEGLQLLQRLRDEAHRFAITFHRELRGKGQVASVLDGAPGIGVERRKSLLKTFGSVKNIRAASVEELAAAPKMNRNVAEALYAYLRLNAGKSQ